MLVTAAASASALRLGHEAGDAVGDDLERPARVGRRHHRLLGQERLVRHHPEVLVHRRVVDGEAARIQVGELLLRDTAEEARAAVGERLEPVAVGPVAGDDDLEASALRGLEQQVDPLGAVEPADREDEVAVLVAAVRELLRRVRHHLGGDPGRALEPVGDVAGGREDLLGLAEGDPVELLDATADRALLGRLAELPELGAVELVGLPELVDEPDDLVRMADDVAGELGRDHELDPPAVRLVEVEQPPEERLGQHALARVPLERNGDEVGVVSALGELGDEVVREDLDAPSRERHLGAADGDSQVLATIA